MNDIAIKVENLGKKYVINHENGDSDNNFREVVIGNTKKLINKLNPFSSSSSEEIENTTEDFWALNDVNFEIKKGDKIGIIGRNGAGKSTLLKVLSRITEPTTGKIHINGRIASLLEVGTGFHPELTGRENIYLNGAILGMSRKEIKAKFDEIVAFAEVAKFLDTPVKRYSSGMYVRLAFSVAAHLETEILVIDEVLAVGDASFQKKCLGKMNDVSKQGRTILFVSHNIGAVKTLCNKGILLSEGKIVSVNTIEKVTAEYMQQSFIASSHTFVNSKPSKLKVKADVIKAFVLDRDYKATSSLFINQIAFIKIVWRLNINVPFLRVGVEIIDSSGVIVVSSMDTDTTGLYKKPRKSGVFCETMKIPQFLLMPDAYSVRVFAGMPGIERIMEKEDLLSFEVIDSQSHLSHTPNSRRAGYIAIPLSWEIKSSDT